MGLSVVMIWLIRGLKTLNPKLCIKVSGVELGAICDYNGKGFPKGPNTQILVYGFGLRAS